MADSIEFIKECKQHNPLALRELYEKYNSLLMAVCVRYTNNIEDAQDLLHEGFIKIFKNISRFKIKDDGTLEGWMKSIIINTAISNLKKQKHILNIDNVDQEFNLENENDGLPFNDIELDGLTMQSINSDIIKRFNFSKNELIEILKEIPKHYQLVFNMHIIDGMQHEEISKRLNIKVKTSRTRLLRARKLIQLKLYEKCKGKLSK